MYLCQIVFETAVVYHQPRLLASGKIFSPTSLLSKPDKRPETSPKYLDIFKKIRETYFPSLSLPLCGKQGLHGAHAFLIYRHLYLHYNTSFPVQSL